MTMGLAPCVFEQMATILHGYSMTKYDDGSTTIRPRSFNIDGDRFGTTIRPQKIELRIMRVDTGSLAGAVFRGAPSSRNAFENNLIFPRLLWAL